MPSTFSLSRSAFFHTNALSLKKDGGGGGKGETEEEKREFEQK